MNKFIKKYENIWGNNPNSLMTEYDYHPELTQELDQLDGNNLNNEVLYKIVLWKLSRFPYLKEDLFVELKSISKMESGTHREAKDILIKLLKTQGIALPMASTILRFLNPHVFQIIDDRAYRVLFPGESKYPSKTVNITERYLETSTEIYFTYIDKIHKVCCDNFLFNNADRILYLLDIKLGNSIGEKLTTNLSALPH